MMLTLASSPVVFWLTLAIVAAIVELLSPLFGFIFVTVAALAAGALAALGVPLPGQLLVFAVSLLLCLGLIRPRVVARLAAAAGVPSRTERLKGAHGRVVEAVDPVLGTGRIVVEGDDWAARSTSTIPVGTEVIVREADGITLHVDRLN